MGKINTEISHENFINRTNYSIMSLEGKKMTITATEFKKNLGKYLELANEEDIVIMKNGKAIALLTQPQLNKIEILNSLVGIAKGDREVTLEEIKEERTSKL